MPLRKPPAGEGRPRVDHEPKREPKELPKAVKLYVDNTGARIKKIFAELGAKNPDELAEKITAGELSGQQIEQAKIAEELMRFRASAKEKRGLPSGVVERSGQAQVIFSEVIDEAKNINDLKQKSMVFCLAACEMTVVGVDADNTFWDAIETARKIDDDWGRSLALRGVYR
jgi:hypothetical protein